MLEKLLSIKFIINQANVAIANQNNAIIMVSFHFVFSLVSEPNNILYAQIIIKITAIVHEIPSNKSIICINIFGMLSICILHSLTSSFDTIHDQKIHQGPSVKT